MASSQVQLSSSSSPFGCVLRDRNQRDPFRDANANTTTNTNTNARDRDRATATQVVFQNNLKTLVMDRFNDRISISPLSNDNCENHNLNAATVIPNFPIPRSNRNHIHDNANSPDASSIITPRCSSILDRWATKQVPETLSTNDQHTTSTIHSSITSSPTNQDILPIPQMGSSEETSKLGASSLVQIWEKRLNLSNCMNPNSCSNQNSNATACSSRQGPEMVNREHIFSAEAEDFADERFDAGPPSEDSFADWRSNRTSSSSQSPPCSTQSQSSDAGESERVRVADIIRRLTTAANQTQTPLSPWVDENENSNESPCSSVREQVDHKNFSQVVGSPRIRGRQAFADLLMQMERDREKELDRLVERRAVSKFGQRGRIQSLLRLRILKRGMTIEDQRRPPFIPSQGNKSAQGSSTIMHLRERFSRVGENANGGAAQSVSSYTRSPLGEIVNTNTNNSKIQSDGHATFSSSVSSKCSYNGEVGDRTTVVNRIDMVDNSIRRVVKEEVAGPASSDAIWQADTRKLISQVSSASTNEWEENELAVQDHEHEHDGDDQQCEESAYDWFTDISRPRSYWEDRRQTWYHEMLHSNSDKDDIRQLIKRKTVSNFLSSDFRERMDQLMVSRLERQTQQEEEEYDEDSQDEAEELWCYSERHAQAAENSDDEEEEEEVDDDDDDEQEDEASDYLDQSASPLQLASPSILSSWSYQDNEIGEDSNRLASASTSSPQCFGFPSRDNQQCTSLLSNSRSHPSMEMELVYDLRDHMEQLYQEMSELRKSIKCCMEMQLMLQQSVKHKVADDYSPAVAGGVVKKPNMINEKTRKRKCCICHEMQVDSLLYRCGHMCSCMKCGKELQWRGGKCPICGAPIEDVVRAYADL